MATSFARSTGANARSIDWEAEEQKGKTRGNWLPLEALNDKELYAGTPQLRATPMPMPRRESQPNRRPEWLRPTAPQAQQQARPTQQVQVKPTKAQQQQVTVQGVPVGLWVL